MQTSLSLFVSHTRPVTQLSHSRARTHTHAHAVVFKPASPAQKEPGKVEFIEEANAHTQAHTHTLSLASLSLSLNTRHLSLSHSPKYSLPHSHTHTTSHSRVQAGVDSAKRAGEGGVH